MHIIEILLAWIIAITAPMPATTPAPPTPVAAHVNNHTTGYLIIAPPSISAATFEYVLQHHSPPSPLAGVARRYYNMAVSYGVDPAVFLAWWKEENEWFTDGGSSYPNHNFGNLKSGVQYIHYRTFDAGAADMLGLISGSLYGDGRYYTVGKAIPIYAPDHAPDYVSNMERNIDNYRQLDREGY